MHHHHKSNTTFTGQAMLIAIKTIMDES